MSVEVKNLLKLYGEQKALNNISFSAEKGEIVGFLGPNGAGKSTTMKITTCFVAPTSGSVSVCGYDVQSNPMDVRKNLGYLPEHNPLYLDMYVHEYLRFIGRVHGLKGRVLKARVSEMVETTGLVIEQNKRIGQLSKGYRQRVGLAQALIHDPKVLILDEPTTGLDPNQIVEIRKLIKEVAKEKTIIFSTHIMQEVQALCDRAVIINKGEIVANESVTMLQQISDDKIVNIVEFESVINIEFLENISGVIEVNELEGSKYEVISGKIDIRSEIFKIASDNKLPLVGLKQQESSLENIFQTLTKKTDV